MSAFLMQEQHIGLLAAAAFDYGSLQYGITYDHGHKLKTVEQVAQVLAQANLDSIAARYGDSPDSPEYVAGCQRLAAAYLANHRHSRDPVRTVDLCKLANCYDYQACEVSNYYGTLAHKLMIQLRGGLLERLPGYDDSAAWQEAMQV